MEFNKKDFETIVKICERAEALKFAPRERINLIMDLENVHKTIGLRLEELLKADDFDFAHDIVGIQNHMNRKTGQLEDFFVPRYAEQEELDISEIIKNAEERSRAQSVDGAAKSAIEKDI